MNPEDPCSSKVPISLSSKSQPAHATCIKLDDCATPLEMHNHTSTTQQEYWLAGRTRPDHWCQLRSGGPLRGFGATQFSDLLLLNFSKILVESLLLFSSTPLFPRRTDLGGRKVGTLLLRLIHRWVLEFGVWKCSARECFERNSSNSCLFLFLSAVDLFNLHTLGSTCL